MSLNSYQRNTVTIGDAMTTVDAWSAITNDKHVVARLEIKVVSANGSVNAGVEITAEQLRAVAAMATRHADFIDAIKHELDFLQTEAA